ncbi:GTP-binding protein [Hydrogenophaga sp. 5NK40-0174]|uniref:CobW family GTP-binding protein n=1 Tax=Hydrogenophaga sp. 5NK40-0174 TaxID=3127649 RepID=UPI0031034A15
MTNDARTPVTVLTGFLGSGKTTFLQQLLQNEQWRGTAVVINELGETALDHLLVQHVSPHVRLLKSGCVCCSVREDLTQTLSDLNDLRQRKEVSFDRVVVETTGMADPLPVTHTLMTHETLAPTFRLSGTVTVVDAFNGLATIDHHEEARRQVATADAVLLSKCDLTPRSTRDRLEKRLSLMNPSAAMLRVAHGALSPDDHLVLDHLDHPYPAWRPKVSSSPKASSWLFMASTGRKASLFDGSHTSHTADIQTLCLTASEPFEEQPFQHWLSLLTAMRGEHLLRFKGLIHIAEKPDRPLVVHAAQHLVHPPLALPAWPGPDRRSHLVFITQGMDPDVIERTLHKFTGSLAVPEVL